MKKTLLTSLICCFASLSSGLIQAQEINNDAKLKLEVNLNDVVCYGDKTTLSIDTFGTGKFNEPDKVSLEVIAKAENDSTYKLNNFYVTHGMLMKDITPEENTSYTVSFSYLDQRIDTTINLVVFRFEVATEDVAICDGDQLTLSATVSPAGSRIEWFDSDEVTPLGTDEVNVSPSSDNHVHRYYARPYSDLVYCKSNIMQALDVTVNSLPRIESIDSVGYRDVEIMMDPMSGSEFSFKVDDTEWTKDHRINGLTYSEHNLVVKNEAGCETATKFVINVPDIPIIVDPVIPDEGDDNSVESISAEEKDRIVNVYTISGGLVKSNVKKSDALDDLLPGKYIVGHEKVIKK